MDVQLLIMQKYWPFINTSTRHFISELCNKLYDDGVVFTACCEGLVCYMMGTEESRGVVLKRSGGILELKLN